MSSFPIGAELLDAVLASLRAAILICDERQEATYANDAALAYFGQSQATLIGLSLLDVLQLADPRRSRLHYQLNSGAFHRDGRQPDAEFESNTRLFRYQLFPVYVRSGARLLAGMMICDVTEERPLRDRLLQAEKLVGLGTLVSGMAHEINTPSQAILGTAELILMSTISTRSWNTRKTLRATRYTLEVWFGISLPLCDRRPKMKRAK
ncbi:MAG: hypothetical protein C4293_10950 [Nitrospiraceae bacterium]